MIAINTVVVVLDMEKDNKKVDWNGVGFSLLLFCGMIYGVHHNYVEFVAHKAITIDSNWLEKCFYSVVYTLGDIALMCLLCVDKVIYNAQFHAFMANWSRQMHPNGDMVGLGTLITLICFGIDVIGKLLYKLNHAGPR